MRCVWEDPWSIVRAAGARRSAEPKYPGWVRLLLWVVLIAGFGGMFWFFLFDAVF